MKIDAATTLKNTDTELCLYVNELLLDSGFRSKIVLYEENGIQRVWEIIKNFDLYLSVRLHGAITAYLLDTPFVLFPYHEKCCEFLKSIGKEFIDIRYVEKSSDLAVLYSYLEKLTGQSPSPAVKPLDYAEMSMKNFTKSAIRERL